MISEYKIKSAMS